MDKNTREAKKIHDRFFGGEGGMVNHSLIEQIAEALRKRSEEARAEKEQMKAELQHTILELEAEVAKEKHNATLNLLEVYKRVEQLQADLDVATEELEDEMKTTKALRRKVKEQETEYKTIDELLSVAKTALEDIVGENTDEPNFVHRMKEYAEKALDKIENQVACCPHCGSMNIHKRGIGDEVYDCCDDCEKWIG